MTNQISLAVDAIQQQYLGMPYIYGGSGWKGIDCSGIAVEYLKIIGQIPREGDATSDDIRKLLTERKATWYSITNDMDIQLLAKLQLIPKGSLICYDWNADGKTDHVAIALGNGLQLSASGGNYRTLTEEDARKKNARVKITQTPHFMTGAIQELFIPID